MKNVIVTVFRIVSKEGLNIVVVVVVVVVVVAVVVVVVVGRGGAISAFRDAVDWEFDQSTTDECRGTAASNCEQTILQYLIS